MATVLPPSEVWILDVVEDLATFARRNSLLVSAEAIDDLKFVLASEMSYEVKDGEVDDFYPAEI